MAKSTDGQSHSDTDWQVIAVIYDRNATPSRAYLDVRLQACREYAAERGWTVAGEFVDHGDSALNDRSRPGLDDALAAVEKAAGEPTAQAALLVYDCGRLSHDPLNQASWMYRVNASGGSVVTVQNENFPPARDAGRPGDSTRGVRQ